MFIFFTYNVINEHKTKLINTLRWIKTGGRIGENTYKRLYPTVAGHPKFYGLPKFHKKDTPLGP